MEAVEAVEAVEETVPTLTAVSECKWSSGGSADGGGGFGRRDGGQLACSGSVVWLHRLRKVEAAQVVE